MIKQYPYVQLKINDNGYLEPTKPCNYDAEVKFYTTEQFREKYGKNNENWKDRSRLETNQLDAIGGKEEEKPVEKKIDKQVVPKATVIEPEEITDAYIILKIL